MDELQNPSTPPETETKTPSETTNSNNEVIISDIKIEDYQKFVTYLKEHKDVPDNIQNSVVGFGNILIGILIGYIAIKAVFDQWK